jgi:hypothetical protein
MFAALRAAPWPVQVLVALALVALSVWMLRRLR